MTYKHLEVHFLLKDSSYLTLREEVINSTDSYEQRVANLFKSSKVCEILIHYFKRFGERSRFDYKVVGVKVHI